MLLYRSNPPIKDLLSRFKKKVLQRCSWKQKCRVAPLVSCDLLEAATGLRTYKMGAISNQTKQQGYKVVL